MQMQTNTGIKKGKAQKKFKVGDKVTWKSHAGGYATKKVGTIVAAFEPSDEYGPSQYKTIPNAVYIDILRNEGGMTRDAAREELKKAHYTSWYAQTLELRYKFKFGYSEGMNRSETHYFVAVDRAGLKPWLYHPKTSTLSLL